MGHGKKILKLSWLTTMVVGMLLPALPTEARPRGISSSSRTSLRAPAGLRRVTGRRLARMGRQKVRPTPTAPKIRIRDLASLGINVYAQKRPARVKTSAGRSAKPGLVFRPGKNFDYRAAASLGLVAYSRKGDNLLRYKNPSPTAGQAKPSLYPRQRRSLAASFSPGKGRGRVKVAFFDADSTLRVSKSGSPSADSAHDLVLLPMVAKKISSLAKKGYLIAIVSNQAGVNDGYITKAIANSGLRNMCRLLSKAGAPVHYYDFAARYDGNRKPKPGMGTRLAKLVRSKHGRQIDWKRSIMVGDSAYKRGKDIQPNGRNGEDFSNSDRRFADSLRKRVRSPKGLKFQHPRDHFGWAQKGVRNFRTLAEVNAFLAVSR